jgi:hypothetical protein
MASRSYQLVVQKGPNPGQVFDLTQAEISIGRELYNDFPIDDRALSSKTWVRRTALM